MKQPNHYATLNIDRCASCAEIKRAYRILAQRFHPDVTEDADGERKFKDVSAAYRALKLPEARSIYDRQIHNICAGARRRPASAKAGRGGLFDFGNIFWRYWPWFWVIDGSSTAKHPFRR